MKPVHEIIPEMWEIFENADPKIILTSRHPDLEPYIQKWVDDCHVCCRDFCLSQNEMTIVESSSEMKKVFLAQMVEWKTGVVNEFAQHYENVIFYDDMIDRFYQEEFEPNVELRLPVHMEESA
jgi:hypothetical protein